MLHMRGKRRRSAGKLHAETSSLVPRGPHAPKCMTTEMQFDAMCLNMDADVVS